jgi:phage major head subunit gpT-like protein
MSDLSLLSSRAIMGMYFARLEQNNGLAWINDIANMFNSDQASETYDFLGQSPVMREWIGARAAKGFTGQGVTVVNKHYEGTIELKKKDIRRDKTPQIRARMSEFADRAQTHWASLLTTLLVNAASTVCYDAQYYFDTDHSEGDSGVQSNKIDVDISGLPCTVHGADGSHPSNEEFQQAVVAGIAQILSFKDDKGEPMNENARKFRIIVGTGLWIPAQAALKALTTANLIQNVNPGLAADITVEVSLNPRLTETDTFYIFRTDSPIKGFIAQTEQEVELKAKAEGSEFEFDNDAHQYGIDAWRGVGLGYWQRACRVRMV